MANNISGNGSLQNLMLGTTLTLANIAAFRGTYIIPVDESLNVARAGRLNLSAAPDSANSFSVQTTGFNVSMAETSLVDWSSPATGTPTPTPTLQLNGDTVNSTEKALGGMLTYHAGSNLTLGTGYLWTLNDGTATHGFNTASNSDAYSLSGDAWARVTNGVNAVQSGVLSGVGNFTLRSGNLSLTANNNYTGTTSIDSGSRLQLGAGGNSGSLGTGNVLNNGTLVFNRSDALSFDNSISGSGTVEKNGGNTVTLTAANNYSGNTTVNAGTLSLLNARSYASANYYVANGAVLDFNVSVAGGASSSPYLLSGGAVATVTGNGTVTLECTGSTDSYCGAGNATSGLLFNMGVGGNLAIQSGNWQWGGGKNSFANNQGDLYLAAGTQWRTSDSNASFNRLSGSGSIGNANTGSALNLNLGVAGGSSTFAGVILAPDTFNGGTVAAVNLIKSGAGTLTLTGSNNYSGTTTLSGGTLQVGEGGNSGSLGTGDVVNNGALVFNRSGAVVVANNISGSGSLSQNGSGTVTLTGNYNYSGNTSVNAGTLSLLNAENANSKNYFVASGAVLDFNVAQSGSAYYLISQNTLTNVTGNGTVSLECTGVSELCVWGSSFVTGLRFNMGEGGNLAIQSGKWAYFKDVKSFSNNQGDLYLARDTKLYLSDEQNSFNRLSGEGTLLNGENRSASLNIGVAGGSSTFAGVIQGPEQDYAELHLIKSGSGTFTLTGNNNYTGSTTILGGTLVVGNGTSGSLGYNATTGLADYASNISNSGQLIFNAVLNQTLSGVVSGSGSLTQNGGNTLTLTADNNYSGTTTINAGTLQVGNGGTAGSLGSSEVVNNATLIVNRSVGSGNLALSSLMGNVSGSGNTTVGFITQVAADTLVIDRNITQNGASSNIVLAAYNATGTSQGNVTIAEGNFVTSSEGGSVTVLADSIANLSRFDAQIVGANSSSGASRFVRFNGSGGTLLSNATTTTGARNYNLRGTASASIANVSARKTYDGNTDVNTSTQLNLSQAIADINGLTGNVRAIQAETASFNNSHVLGDNNTWLNVSFNSAAATTLTDSNSANWSISGASISNYSGASGTVEKRAVTITAEGHSKTYDGGNGTANSTRITNGGFVGTENASFTTAYTDSVHYGEGTRTVNVTNATANAGTDLNDYNLSYVANTASSILKKDVQVTADGHSKTYDGGNGTANATRITNGGFVGNENASFTTAYTDSVHYGEGTRTVNVTNATANAGTDLNDYNLSYVANTASSISKRVVNVNANTSSKTYDGTNVAANADYGTNGVNQGFLAGDNISYAQVYNSTHAGNVTVNLRSTNLISNSTYQSQDSDYEIAYTAGSSTIKQRKLTFTALDQSKTYDGTTNVPNASGYVATGLVAGESMSGVSLAYDNANVGTAKTIEVGSANLTPGANTLLSDYAVNYVNAVNSVILPLPQVQPQTPPDTSAIPTTGGAISLQVQGNSVPPVVASSGSSGGGSGAGGSSSSSISQQARPSAIYTPMPAVLTDIYGLFNGLDTPHVNLPENIQAQTERDLQVTQTGFGLRDAGLGGSASANGSGGVVTGTGSGTSAATTSGETANQAIDRKTTPTLRYAARLATNGAYLLTIKPGFIPLTSETQERSQR